jgi:hypothetical protein
LFFPGIIIPYGSIALRWLSFVAAILSLVFAYHLKKEGIRHRMITAAKVIGIIFVIISGWVAVGTMSLVFLSGFEMMIS